jgi:invasion protein IalB
MIRRSVQIKPWSVASFRFSRFRLNRAYDVSGPGPVCSIEKKGEAEMSRIAVAMTFVAIAAFPFAARAQMLNIAGQKPAPAASAAAPASAAPKKQITAAAPAAAPNPQQVAVKPDLMENSGEWLLQCWKAPEKRCEIFQRRVEAKSQQQVLLVGFSINRNTPRRMTVVTPLGLKAKPALPLFVNKSVIVEAPLKTCIASGCIHIVDVGADQLGRISAAQDMGVVLQLTNDQPVNVALSAKGLGSGMEKAVNFIR